MLGLSSLEAADGDGNRACRHGRAVCADVRQTFVVVAVAVEARLPDLRPSVAVALLFIGCAHTRRNFQVTPTTSHSNHLSRCSRPQLHQLDSSDNNKSYNNLCNTLICCGSVLGFGFSWTRVVQLVVDLALDFRPVVDLTYTTCCAACCTTNPQLIEIRGVCALDDVDRNCTDVNKS